MPSSSTKPDDEAAEVGPSNLDRLRAHLTTGSLASTLLQAWTSSERAAAKPKLLEAIDDFFNQPKPPDAAASPKD